MRTYRVRANELQEHGRLSRRQRNVASAPIYNGDCASKGAAINKKLYIAVRCASGDGRADSDAAVHRDFRRRDGKLRSGR